MLLLLLWILVMLLPITAIEQAWDQQSRSRGLLLQAMSGVMEMERRKIQKQKSPFQSRSRPVVKELMTSPLGVLLLGPHIALLRRRVRPPTTTTPLSQSRHSTKNIPGPGQVHGRLGVVIVFVSRLICRGCYCRKNCFGI
jgi:hypothetical protein